MASTRKTLKWKDSVMTHFLELYQEHECLWNNHCEQYKNRDARETAIRAIINSLNANLTEFDLKNKIKSIRTMYRKELMLIIKSKKNGAESDDVYEPRLTWFRHADSFLRAVTLSRESNSNLNTINQSNIDADEGEPEFKIEVTPFSEESDTVRPTTSTSSSQTFQTTSRKRKVDTTNDGINKLAKNDNCENQRDEFYYFGNFIAIQLRNMPEYDAILCQEELHSVLRQYRLRLVQNPSTSPTYSII